MRTGLETEGAIAGGAIIHKAGKAIYNKIYGKATKGLKKAADQREGGTEGEEGTTPEDTGGDLGSSSGQGQEIEMTDRSQPQNAPERGRVIESDDNVSRPTNARPGEGGGEQGEGVEMTDRSQGRIGRERGVDDGETKEGDMGDETKEGDIGDLGEDLAQDAGDAITAGTEGAEGAASALSGAGDALAGAASGVGDAVAGGLAAGESALAETAAATSWIPFVGEVLGGIAAVGGLITAGVGVYDDIVGGDQQKESRCYGR